MPADLLRRPPNPMPCMATPTSSPPCAASTTRAAAASRAS